MGGRGKRRMPDHRKRFLSVRERGRAIRRPPSSTNGGRERGDSERLFLHARGGAIVFRKEGRSHGTV